MKLMKVNGDDVVECAQQIQNIETEMYGATVYLDGGYYFTVSHKDVGNLLRVFLRDHQHAHEALYSKSYSYEMPAFEEVLQGSEVV